MKKIYQILICKADEETYGRLSFFPLQNSWKIIKSVIPELLQVGFKDRIGGRIINLKEYKIRKVKVMTIKNKINLKGVITDVKTKTKKPQSRFGAGRCKTQTNT